MTGQDGAETQTPKVQETDGWRAAYAGQGISGEQATGGGQAAPSAGKPDAGGYKASFSALKNSVVTGHDIRKRKGALDKFVSETDKMRTTHADQTDILANYDALVAEQEQSVSTCASRLEQANAELASAQSELSSVTEALKSMRAEHAKSLSTLKAKLDAEVDSAEATYEQARAAKKLVQAKLDGASADVEASADNAQAKEAVSELKGQVEDAKIAEREAKDSLGDTKAQAKRQMRDAKQACEDKEEPLASKVDELKSSIRRLEGEIETSTETKEKAEKRIQYCQQVKADPSQVDALAAQIQQRDGKAQDMRSQIDGLSAAYAQSRERGRKARNIAIVAAVLVIVVVIVVVAIVTSGH